jgi:WD40 repeat protein/serine/threonine protein kinase
MSNCPACQYPLPDNGSSGRCPVCGQPIAPLPSGVLETSHRAIDESAAKPSQPLATLAPGSVAPGGGPTPDVSPPTLPPQPALKVEAVAAGGGSSSVRPPTPVAPSSGSGRDTTSPPGQPAKPDASIRDTTPRSLLPTYAPTGQVSAPTKPDAPPDSSSRPTYQPGGPPPQIPADIQQTWGDVVKPGDSPRESIKGPSHTGPVSSALVVKPRALQHYYQRDPAQAPPDYELIDLLGKGGMGIVYAARQSSVDRIVALKMVKPEISGDAELRQKFLAEAVVTGDLDHPNIVPIYDVGTDAGNALFYSMKRVQGTPWSDVIDRQSLEGNLDVLMKVADAVAFAHSRAVLHRDLKPANVMLGEFGEVLVMDWGLAVSVPDPSGRAGKAEALTPATSVGGTPAYMAPEMASSKKGPVGTHSDIYLLGALLYELFTHQYPHNGRDNYEALANAAENRIEPTDKSGELLDIALKAMATKPTDRYATVREFQQAIRDYRSHAQSIVLTDRAGHDLSDAQPASDYQLFSRAVFGFQEALVLWSGNAKAQTGLTEAQFAYASAAYAKGDFDLGASLLNVSVPAHAELNRKLVDARAERELRQQRLHQARRFGGLLVALVFVVITTAFFWIRNERDLKEEQRVAAVNAGEREKKAKEKEADARKDAEAKKKEAELARDAEAEAKKQETQAKNAAIAAENVAVEQKNLAVAAKRAEEYEAYVAQIGLAAAKIDENAFDSAREILSRCKHELRNWEWGRLMHLCSQATSTVEIGAPVDAVAVSPDGRRIVTANWNGRAELRDASSRKVIATLPHEGKYVHAAAFSPDDNLIATGSNDESGFLKLWDAKSGQFLRNLDGHADAVLHVAFSRDSRRLLTSSYDKSARLWDVTAGRELQSFVGHDWWVWDAEFSPDEKSIVTASQDGTVIVWSVATAEAGPAFTGHQGPVYAATFAPDGKQVVSGGYDHRVLVWRPDEIEPLDAAKLVGGEAATAPRYRTFDGHTSAVRSVSLAPDGRQVVTSSHDNSVRVWELATGKALRTFRGHGGPVRAAVFAPDGKSVFSGGHDQHVMRWSIADYEEIRVLHGRVFEGHADAVLSAAFSRDGNRIVTASRDRSAKVWDAKSGRELNALEEGHSFLASSALFFPDGRRLITGAVDNTVCVWDVSTGGQLLRLERTGRGAALALSPDSRWIVTGSDAKSAKVWEADSGRLLRELKDQHTASVSAVAVSLDGQLIATGDAGGQCHLWTAAGQHMQALNGHTRKVSAIVFHPDRRHLLTASHDKLVSVWDIESGKELPAASLKHPESVLSLALNRDGTQAITSCADGGVRVFDLRTSKEVRKLPISEGLVNSVALSRDDRWAITVSTDVHRVRLWDWQTSREVLRDFGEAKSVPFLDGGRTGVFVWSAAFAPDSAAIVTVGGSEATLWEIPTGRQMLSFSPHAAVASAAFSTDGQRVVTGSWDNSAKIWNLDANRVELKLEGEHTGYVNAVAFSPTGDMVLTASDDHTARLWDAKSGKVLRTFTGHTDRVRHAVFSADGRHVLTASTDATARLWSTATAELVREFKGHEMGLLAAAISSDGKIVLTGSEDGTAKLWDAATGRELRTLAGHTARVTCVALSPDTSRVLTGSQDHSIKLWDARTGKELLTLKGHTQEVTSVSFSTDGRLALSSSRDGTAVLWLAQKVERVTSAE